MAEWDLKPTLGPLLEEAIKEISGVYIPSRFLDHVTTEKLTVDRRATVRGRIVVQYGEWRKVPGLRNPVGGGWIRRPQRWKVWSARIVIHWTSYYANAQLSDIRVDVGHIHGAVNTGAVRKTVVRWLKRQVGHIKTFLRGKGVTGKKAIVTIHNKNQVKLFFQLRWRVGNDSTGWIKWNIDAGSKSWFDYPGATACEIRFDYSSRDGFQERSYNLPVNQIPTSQRSSLSKGRPYQFVWKNNQWDLKKGAPG